MTTKFYRVLIPGRQCLMQGEQKKLEVGDIICSTFGLFMLKVATSKNKSVTTSMFKTEPDWDKNIGQYEEITDKNELRKLIPHLPTGKTFRHFVGDVKSEMIKRLTN